ncbi:unnamed protein product [Adineta ricciae]|uniref:Glutamate--cysteine ligase n=1 Tax=Adineta ricciae TaxID=249248 RepID=A0A814X0F7_ADIRI|nr:unnamed protein product [Adineta ricciae]CAF1205044.1 unnamed protein product [Adineta ricciae]
MGVLSEGTALSWKEIASVSDVYRSYALDQLIRVFEKYKDQKGDSFQWGDELEFAMVRFDHSNKRVQLLLSGHEVLPPLKEMNETVEEDTHRIAWHPEACNYMVEGVPSQPYGYVSSYLNTVEANMALRRNQVQQILSKKSDCEFVLNLAAFPRYGHGQYIHPPEENGSDQSFYYPEILISPVHPRMKSVLLNINERRSLPAPVAIPIFRDSSTPKPFQDSPWKDKIDIQDDHIYLDGCLAGWGCCCLQVTFKAQSLSECLQVYDQLLPLTAIMLALSNACPIWRGYLTEMDSRYEAVFQAGDDRTPEERQRPTLNSRCAPTPFYLCDEHNHLNDVELDSKLTEFFYKIGMSPTLAHHFGHLFIRDPLVIIKENLYPTDDTTSYHFENLNSTVWHSLRFKPPPLDDGKMGWRVEFRPMDIQITDFENASLTVFMALLTRVILTFELDLTIPISQVNENITRAHHRDSVRQEKFHFRIADKISLLSINEIINGIGDFPGLVPLVQKYLDAMEDITSDTRCTIEKYLSLISKRAAGTLLTDASWIRQFVTTHPSYKQDSVVTDEIQHDLIWKIQQIANGHEACPQLIQSRMRTHTNLCPE